MNRRQMFVVALGVASIGAFSRLAPAQTGTSRDPNQVAAKVERSLLTLTSPDRYRVPIIVEPLRRVAVMAPEDGVLQMVSVTVGANVREGQEIARLDSKAVMARLRIAAASVKENQAVYDEAVKLNTPPAPLATAEARLDAARARAELAQIEVDSHILRAPFAGRVINVHVSAGQYLSKGTTILDIDDVSSVRILIPVDRVAVPVGGSLNFTIEGNPASGRVQAVLPLNESQASLRELVAPLAAAWLIVPNPAGTLEPGQRAQSPFLPNAPITGVPASALKKGDDSKPSVQVIRAERVTNIAVQVFGPLGPDRSQVSGPFRPSDILITFSSVPLVPGTFIRFNDAPAPREVEGVPPSADHVGEAADVGRPLIAPIGEGGVTKPSRKPGTGSSGSSLKPGTPF